MKARAGGLVAVAVLLAAGCSSEARPASRPTEDVGSPSSTTTPSPRAARPEPSALPPCFGRRATVVGSRGDDRISGTRREDVIVTRSGDDVVTGLRDDDRVCTGRGDDRVGAVDHWQAQVDLGQGDDRIAGVQDMATAWAGPGDDRLTLPSEAISVALGRGDDLLRALGDVDHRIPQNSPCVSYGRAPGRMRINLARGWAHGQGTDRLLRVRCVIGTPKGDRIVGSRHPDDVEAWGGDNVVRSRGGNDVVYSNGLQGDDRFHLGAGNDSSMSGIGADRVYGGEGADFVESGYGPDYVEGGGGNDTLHAGYRCDFGSSGGAGTADRWGNEIFGGDGDDYLAGDLGNDRLDGGAGTDRGQGGYRDGRADWIESLEVFLDC